MIMGVTQQGLKRTIKSIKEHIEYANKKLFERLSQEEVGFWMGFKDNEIMMLNWFQSWLLKRNNH